MPLTPQSIAWVAFALLVSLIVAIFPVPADYAWLRPELLCLLVIYWILYSPQPVGVGLAWLVGLLQDVVEGSVWGGHALALAFVAYICLMSYRRLRSYALSQQTFWVMVFVGIHQIFVNWVQGINGYSAPATQILGSTLVSALLWPVLRLLMLRIGVRTV